MNKSKYIFIVKQKFILGFILSLLMGNAFALSEKPSDSGSDKIKSLQIIEKGSDTGKITKKINSKNQILFQIPPAKTPEMDKIFTEKSQKELREAFEAIGFDPSEYYEDDYPYVNFCLSIEKSSNAIKIFEAYRHKLDPNRKDYEGQTALITAVKIYSADEAVLFLLKNFKEKIDVNAQDNDGATALHYVAAYGKRDLALALIEAGANANIKDKKGRIPLDYAKMNENEVRDILMSIEISPDRDSHAIHNVLFYSLIGTSHPLSDCPATVQGLKSAIEYFKTDNKNIDLLFFFERMFQNQLGRDYGCFLLTEDTLDKTINILSNALTQFSGKPIIRVCMDSKPAIAELLLK